MNPLASRTFRDKNNNNKADCLLRLNLNVFIDVDNRKRARVKGKQQGDQFRLKKNITILHITAVIKRGNVSGHQSEKERQRKKSEQEHIKRVTRKFVGVTRCSRAKQNDMQNKNFSEMRILENDGGGMTFIHHKLKR